MIMKASNKRVKRDSERSVIETREQLEACVGEIAALTIERDSLLCDMDARIKEIRDEFETRLAELEADRDAELRLALAWAKAHPSTFEGRRSIELTHGTLGYRLGNPALKTLRGFTWVRVLENLVLLKMFGYVRSRQEPDKEKLLADRAMIGEEQLKALGVKVEQAETFFVEPKRETAPEAAQGGRA